MNDFQLATRTKLRFETVKGLLSVEQLWELKTTELASVIKATNKILKDAKVEDDELDFLSGTKSKVNKIDQCRFNVLKEIFTIKKAEEDEKANEKAVKEHNAKIDALIAKKQDEKLENQSIEELLKMKK